MSKVVDLLGQRFGKLVVSERVLKDGRPRWICICDCGNSTEVYSFNLTKGDVRSCACIRRQMTIERNYKHGYSKSPTYEAWGGMLKRCRSPHTKGWKNWGGRGISVCERWNTFLNFLEDMGPKPSPELTLDRINNDGNYEPGNCRWATRKEQRANQRPYKKRRKQTAPLPRRGKRLVDDKTVCSPRR